MRNYHTHETKKSIRLDFNPTSFHLVDYKKLASVESKKTSGVATLLAMGSENGHAYLYKDDSSESQLIAKTESGIAYGAITAVSIRADGQSLLCATESGEVISFALGETLTSRNK